MISKRTIISESAGPIFTIFSPNDDRSGPHFLISQGKLLPYGSQFCGGGKWQTPKIRRFGIPKRYGISLAQCAP